jgi:hypothetical protein
MGRVIPAFAVLALVVAGCGKSAPGGYNDPPKLAKSVEARWNAAVKPNQRNHQSGSITLHEHVSDVLCVRISTPREYNCTGLVHAGLGASASVVRASKRVLVSPDGKSWITRE